MRKGLPWNLGQFGSNTSFTMARTNYVAAVDAKKKLLEIASKALGGAADVLILLPMVTPEIVTGTSLLLFFALVFVTFVFVTIVAVFLLLVLSRHDGDSSRATYGVNQPDCVRQEDMARDAL